MFKKIVVPLDGSKLAEAALPFACEMAAKFDGEITLLRIVPAPMVLGNPTNVAYADLVVTLRTHNRDEASVYLNRLKGSLRREGFRVHTQIIEDDRAAKTILSFVKAQDMELIVMSTHGRGGLARWVYGSVADKVLRYSPIPVLLIRSYKETLGLKAPSIIGEVEMHSHNPMKSDAGETDTSTNKLTVRELMTPSPAIVLPDTSMRHVYKLMKTKPCRQLPVVDHGRLIGIITDRDLRLALNESSMEHISWGNDSRLDRLVAKDFMTENPATVTPLTSARIAADMLATFKFGALPVMEDGSLVGIVTVTDFLNYFIEHQPSVVLDKQ